MKTGKQKMPYGILSFVLLGIVLIFLPITMMQWEADKKDSAPFTATNTVSPTPQVGGVGTVTNQPVTVTGTARAEFEK